MRRVLLLLLLLPSACASMNARFTVDMPASLTEAKHTASFFGAYKEGRMDPDYQRALAPTLASVFGKACPALFGELLQADPQLFTRVDQQTMDDGPSDEVLGEIAARAQGDLIAVVSSFGRLPKPRGALDRTPMQHEGYGGRRGGRRVQSARPTGDDEALELSLSLYAPAQHMTVARVSMRYTGRDEGEALRLFADKLAATLPDVTCADWR